MTLKDIDNYKTPLFLAKRLSEESDMCLSCAKKDIREAKRMLYLSVISGEAVAPSNKVDLAWHTMLLFTRFYKEFSEFIGAFIHHDPTPPEEEKLLTKKGNHLETDTYTKTKENYKKYFGETPDSEYWP